MPDDPLSPDSSRDQRPRYGESAQDHRWRDLRERLDDMRLDLRERIVEVRNAVSNDVVELKKEVAALREGKADKRVETWVQAIAGLIVTAVILALVNLVVRTAEDVTPAIPSEVGRKP